METKTIFFIGKPGCGKGDQARLLSEKTGWPIKSTGEEFRAISVESTPLGRKVRQVNDAGLLQPHWLASYLFFKQLFALTEDDGIIFDGVARKVPEAELVVEALNWIGRPFSVLHLSVSDEEIKHRISLRKGIEGRADDNVLEERLKEFHTFTEPVIEMFRKEGMLIEINGEGTREAIAEDIRKTLSIE
ncbi:hypothetical protein A2609_00825 [Candidatus Kaiserbacteria bacterium RIFOXYD1_FULL_47_14]|uniref:Adenylate kinase n=1 Tax=Candidatus Kaiserbacteria bacterium RIFOXYD1_FULL_47_14 TaxID=1798533 RepID=A0A1F6G6P4_9BACT|nr:MAG: hypothetical protein A2609_00825 [Candidatus Kaiserbacteria bacterium RIFOXYD1_FULL_47_14]